MCWALVGKLPACRRPRYAAAPALGVNTRSRRSSIAAVHRRRPCLSRGRVASVEQSARFRHGVNVAAHVQATPEDCTVREKLLNTGCFRRLEHLPSHVILYARAAVTGKDRSPSVSRRREPWYSRRTEQAYQLKQLIAEFHYTDPTGPARTQRSFAAKKVRAGPVGSVSGPCSGI